MTWWPAPCLAQSQPSSVSVESSGSDGCNRVNHIVTDTATTTMKRKRLPFASVPHSWSARVVVRCGLGRSLSASLPPGVRPRGRRSRVTDGQAPGQTPRSLRPSDGLHLRFVGCIQLSLPRFPAMDDSRFHHRCRDRRHRARRGLDSSISLQ